MKILHTSDWHIGKRLGNIERLSEQEQVLNEIADLCEQEKIELVLVAGDIFDTYLPGAEAEALFFKKIKRIANGKRAVLIISGNHDDGVRLTAGSPLAEEQGIFIVGNERRNLPLATIGDVKLVDSGEGFVVFENGAGEKAFVNCLPYPNEARFKEEKSELSYVERIGEWIFRAEQKNTQKLPSILLSHIFVLGGEKAEGEREIDLGGARALPTSALPKSDYIALGHLHKKQKMGKGHCYYSGSPLQYSFDEAGTEKVVKIFDLTANGVENLRDIPLQSGRRLARLQAVTPEEGEKILSANADKWSELTLRLKAPLTASEAAALSAHENLVSLITQVQTEETVQFVSRKGYSDEKLFEEFYRSVYGVEPEQELKEAFLSALGSVEE
ncbi:MAG: exonuclease subunit SbcD [Clostridia bacterium]|nr:exonuclease subunit SbcD [Clostridia bacterium]